ncbi:archaellin/type IV pilin N-terminal domain-containing protein [Natrarchaeobius sp. A-rgal3]|uniref:archaellin/type IV pilin N-terminal domain-containing protein n=1 Tax=Natrarchaeobius versutus TaxID=1679078 RepID=UPI00350F8171
MKPTNTTNDRGQVGIGTLIVFIAMVLVAAIAAGVLINTAGFLQTQAQATGEESTAQVSDNVQAVNEVGYLDPDSFSATEYDTAPDDEIHRIEVVVQKSPGADRIDLSQATIEYLADGAETLTHQEFDFDDDGEISSTDVLDDEEDSYFFTTREVRGDNDDRLINDDDRIAIVIPLGDDFDYGNTGWIEEDGGTPGTLPGDGDISQPAFLGEGDEAEMTITTPQGSRTIVHLSAPDILDEDDRPAVSL